MNKELNDFILVSRNNKVSDGDIKGNLLAKGWNIKEIEQSFFVISGGDKSQLKSSLQDEHDVKMKNRFAVTALSLFAVSLFVYVLAYFGVFAGNKILSIASLLTIFLSAFVGIVFGVVGLKSNKKVIASFGLVLNVLMILWIVLIVIVVSAHTNGSGQ